MPIEARKGEYECKAEIIVVNGNIEEIIITNVKGRKPLKGKELINLKTFVEHYADDIVDKWVHYFVYHREIDFEKITQKLLDMKITEQYIKQSELSNLSVTGANYIGEFAIR